MALTGFKPQVVERSIKSVNDAFEDLQDALITVTQNQFVLPMTSLWCCKESVDFFRNKFQPAIDALNNGAFQTFKSVIEAMDSSANDWARRTGNTSDWRKKTFNSRLKKIDVSGIKDRNAAGEIGIDEVQSVAKAGLLLTKTFVKAQLAVTKAKNAVALCGFLGGSQAESLQRSLQTISTSIENTTKDLATAAKQSIQSSAEGYKSVGASISNAFSVGK